MNTEINPNPQRSTLSRYQRLLVYVVLLMLGYAIARRLIACLEARGKSLW
jgi:hypothetical protein